MYSLACHLPRLAQSECYIRSKLKLCQYFRCFQLADAEVSLCLKCTCIYTRYRNLKENRVCTDFVLLISHILMYYVFKTIKTDLVLYFFKFGYLVEEAKKLKLYRFFRKQHFKALYVDKIVHMRLGFLSFSHSWYVTPVPQSESASLCLVCKL